MQAVPGLDLSGAGLGQCRDDGGRGGAGGVDLDAAPSGTGQRLGGPLQRREVRRRADLARLGVEEQRRERGDAGEAASLQRIKPVGDGGDLVGRESALVAAVECIALGLDAGEQRLHVARGGGRGGRLAGLLLVEHGPVVGPQGGCRPRLGAGHLREMPEVADR